MQIYLARLFGRLEIFDEAVKRKRRRLGALRERRNRELRKLLRRVNRTLGGLITPGSTAGTT